MTDNLEWRRKHSKALTWDDLANDYDKQHKSGRPARIQPMEDIFKWASDQKDRYAIHPTENTLHRKLI